MRGKQQSLQVFLFVPEVMIVFYSFYNMWFTVQESRPHLHLATSAALGS